MARIVKHHLIALEHNGLTVSFERVATGADSFQLRRENGTARQSIDWEARDNAGELVYFGTVYRCYDHKLPCNERVTYETDINRKRSDGHVTLVRANALPVLRQMVYKTAKAIIGAWSHMNSPNYHDQQYLRYDDATGLFRSVDSATPAADAARAQADSDIEPQTVEIGMNWKLAMPILIMVLENGTPEGKASAKAELMRLANAIDELNVKGSN